LRAKKLHRESLFTSELPQLKSAVREPKGGQYVVNDDVELAGAQLESPRHRPVAVVVEY
jgi:hypothetical protein